MDPVLDGAGLRIAVVAGRFNDHVTIRLLDGVRRGLAACGVAESDVVEPGCPAPSSSRWRPRPSPGRPSRCAWSASGCVIRGETTHYEAVAGECAAGIQQAQLDTGVPIAFGVLTTENLDQALDRSEGAGGHNVGEEGAKVVVEMARLAEQVNELRRGGSAPGFAR